jgi:diguanylate cyclase (GGDEF)-like protein
MDCTTAMALISARIDRELQPSESALLDAHLRECPPCRELEDAFLAQDRRLRRGFAPDRQAVLALPSQLNAEPSAPWRRPGRPSLLVVDDKPYITDLLSRQLADDFAVRTANSAEVAQEALTREPADVVLTDLKMRGRSGVQLLEWVRLHHPRTVRILMTGYGQLGDAIEAINRVQVFHYLEKPCRIEVLRPVLQRAAAALEEDRARQQREEELARLNRELESRFERRTLALEEANALLQRRARELAQLALNDPLTGLFNRRAMDQLTALELKRHARYPSPLTLGLFDVDHFKRVNEAHLFTGGDVVLRGLADLLTRSLRETDSVGRIGGDTFLVLARETDGQGAPPLAERIRSIVADTPIEYNGRAIPITMSMGFAVAEVGASVDHDALREAAATALARAKQQGRNRYVIQNLFPSAG